MAAISLAINGILALIFGLVILVWPKALNLTVALYLIIIGIVQLVQGFI